MAFFKNKEFLQYSDDKFFDEFTAARFIAPASGIYRCRACGYEIATAQGRTLPMQSHDRHPLDKPIHWQLIVAAKAS